MLATAIAALLVLATTAHAASKYNYGDRSSYAPSYKKYDSGHETYKMSAYSHEPSYESHYAEDDYRESDHDSSGGDAYSEEPSHTYESRPTYKQSHEPRSEYRHKQSVSYGYGDDSYGKSYGKSYRHKRQAGEESREGNQFPGIFTPFGGLGGGFGGLGAVVGGGLTSPGVAGLENCKCNCDCEPPTHSAGGSREGNQFGGSFGGGFLGGAPKLLDKIGNICIVEMQC